MTATVIQFDPIHRGQGYEYGKITDPSALAGRIPPEREWLVADLIPRGKVTLFTGDGGLGKTLLMQQLASCVATGDSWLGLPTRAGNAFCLFCEDSDEELHRRQMGIAASLRRDVEELWRLRWLSGEGQDCTLMSFDGERARSKLTERYLSMLAWLRQFKPELVVIDTLADTFGGNELVRHQVRTFINTCLGRICQETGASVVLCGHPSQIGLSSGSGFSGSTAWHNSVRSRIYLQRPEPRNGVQDPDERLLTTKKQNYARSTGEIRLRWDRGAFVTVGTRNRGAPTDARAAADRAYLDGLAVLTARGENASPSPSQVSYSPKRITNLQEADGFKVADMQAAHERLLRAGRIAIETYGPPSKQRHRVVISLAAVANPLT